MDAGATSLALRLGLGMRLPGTGETAAAAARRLEERIGAAEGIANIRRWLLIIGADNPECCGNKMREDFVRYAADT